MKIDNYTLKLDSFSAASIRSLLKDAIQKETVLIEISEKHLDSQPSMEKVIDFSKELRAIYAQAYEMLVRPDDGQT